MSDLNKEALDVWGALKPMIDQEISSRTQGMVQRRKAKVTTAPSLATNTIGVTEAFGQEIFLPFVSNMISAKVGDFVWIEWMYGATNAFVSSYAAVDDKNVSVAGVLDVVPRRCFAALLQTGWYRIMQVEWANDTEATGQDGLMVDFYIVRRGGSAYAEDHKITLASHRVDSFAFIGEISYSGYQRFTKIRCTRIGKYNYVDIRYEGTGDDVSIHFSPYASSLARMQGITSMGLTAVADSPSGETVLTEYGFAMNGNNSFKTISVSKTTTSGYFNVTDASITNNSRVIATPQYFSGATIPWFIMMQPQSGNCNVYVRDVNGNVPANGTQIDLDILIDNR